MNNVTTVIFEKKTNLLPYYRQKVSSGEWQYSESVENEYSKDRRVTLIVAFGTNSEEKAVARIKSPVNPLPVRGEFEYASKSALFDFLRKDGWVPIPSMHKSTLRICDSFRSQR